jgi:hypothetical protein
MEGMTRIVREISKSGLGSFLAVLKLLGPENGNYLSFPCQGYTLALDFKIESRLFSLLDRLNTIVLDYGGRLYLTKDVNMRPEMMEAGYPLLGKFRALRSKLRLNECFQSLQSKRLEL